MEWKWVETWQLIVAIPSALMTLLGLKKGWSARSLVRFVRRRINLEREMAVLILKNQSLEWTVEELTGIVKSSRRNAEVIDLFVGRELDSPEESQNSHPTSETN